jgi:hypothetical protein
MEIYIANKKSKLENIQKKYPSAIILDITSTSKYRGLRVLSPFYPHGNIPIPGMNGKTATCVEAIWQGLKVFENYGVDYATFRNDTMKDIKRSVRKYGKPLGHKFGDKLLNYKDARWLIYLPTYLYVLENEQVVQDTLAKIKDKLKESDIVFLDYNTNYNIADYSKPLSHAGLVKLYLEGKYPKYEERDNYEAENKTIIVYQSIDSLIDAIKSHEKFKETKHGCYIEQMRKMENVEIERVLALNGKKRDGWKNIVNDVQKPNRPKQLTLF